MTDTMKPDLSDSSALPLPDGTEVATAHKLTSSEAVQALVLAGARAEGDPLSLSEGVVSKAVIDVGGQTMLSRVLRALAASRASLPAYVVALDASVLKYAAGGIACRAIEEQGKGAAASLLMALEGSVTTPVLVTTCDHALLTPEMIDTFLEQSVASDVDLAVAVAERSVIEADYPQTRRSYLRLGGAELSSCNMYYLATPKAISAVQFWQSIEKDRKNPWRHVWKLGPIAVLRLLLVRSGPEAMFAMLLRRIGVRGRLHILPFAEAAIDVDKADDLVLVREIIARREK